MTGIGTDLKIFLSVFICEIRVPFLLGNKSREQGDSNESDCRRS